MKFFLEKYSLAERLTLLIFSMTIFGLIMLSSVSAPMAFQKFGDSYFFLKRQIFFGFIPGAITFYFLSHGDYRRLKKYGVWFFVISVVMLISVFIPGFGAQYGSARSWVNIFGFSFQPSELVKLTFLLYLASWFEKRHISQVKSFREGFLPFISSLGVIAIFIMLQPDLGTLIMMVVIAITVFFLAGMSWRDFFLLLFGGAMFLVLTIRMAPYRMARLTAFLHPESDPLGIGYHINQALLAIGSGGIFGVGFGQSRQKFLYLPEVASDSIFAIMAEELGFLFVLFVPLAFLLFARWGIKVARESKDNFGKYVALGIVAWFTMQAFFNIGAMLGILPLTGIPLPFMSYGGTALFVSLSAAGILVSIAKET